MKYLLILPALFLCACGECPVVKSDREIHDIEWPGGSCRGVVEAVGVRFSEWDRFETQFIAKCDDGRTVYNLSNFTVSNFTVGK